jgi:uncharacterized protein
MVGILLYVLLGVAAGIVSGLVGIGGGIIIVPALVCLYGLSQHQAQGTTLALMVPPIGLLAALSYYKQGYVNIPVAIYICIGFVLGSLLGAKAAIGIDDHVLKRIFGGLLLLVALKMILTK